MPMLTKETKERVIENHLRHYKTYRVGISNCQKQLDYIMPSLVSNFVTNNDGSFFYIANNTENVALDRIESKRALDLKEEINQYQIIVDSIDNALEELKDREKDFVQLRYFDCLPIYEVKDRMGYSDEKSIYKIRRHVLDKLLISLNSILIIK